MNIIVSGASKGIGYQVALQAAELGHNVLAIARNGELLDRLKAKSNIITVLKIDLVSDDGLESIANWRNNVGKVDVLINNAGQHLDKSVMNTSWIFRSYCATYSGHIVPHKTDVISRPNLHINL